MMISITSFYLMPLIKWIRINKGAKTLFKACIFDMDGVIIDSEPMHFEIDLIMTRQLGLNLTHEDLEKYVGMTNPAMWKHIKEVHHLELSVDELIRMQMDMKLRILKERDDKPIEGIVSLLQALQSAGYPIGLASSSPILFIQAVLDKLQLKPYFSVIVSGEEVPQGKPAPDVFLKAAKLLQVEAEHCVVIEDSRNGVAAAKAAGMTCIGFVNLNSGLQDLTRADFIVDSITQITVSKLKNL
jgi:beta-phosphoglucomutase family hydrolase